MQVQYSISTNDRLWSKVWNDEPHIPKRSILFLPTLINDRRFKITNWNYKTIFCFCQWSFYDQRFEIINPKYKYNICFCQRSFNDRRFEITNPKYKYNVYFCQRSFNDWRFEITILFLPTIIQRLKAWNNKQKILLLFTIIYMIEVLKLQHIIFLLKIERRGHTVTLKDVDALALKDWDIPYIRR